MPVSSIQRHFLPDAIEDRILEALRRGDYRETLPGERTLAEAFGVCRPTLRRAIKSLVAKGYLKPERGRPTRILAVPAKGGSDAKPNRRVVFLSSHPLHGLSAGTMLSYDLLSAELAASGYELHSTDCEAFRTRQCEPTLAALVRQWPACAYILHQAPPCIQEWFSRNRIPACVMGSPAEGASLPAVDTDFMPAATHAVGALRRQGHDPRRILLLIPRLDLAGHRAMGEGFLNAGGSPSNIIEHPLDDCVWGKWIAQKLLPLLQGPEAATAIVTGWARFTVGLQSALGCRFGITVPETVSIVCLADDPVFDMLIPRVTRYRRNPGRFVRHLKRLVLDLAKRRPVPPGPSFLVPELVPGATLMSPGNASPVAGRKATR